MITPEGAQKKPNIEYANVYQSLHIGLEGYGELSSDIYERVN